MISNLNRKFRAELFDIYLLPYGIIEITSNRTETDEASRNMGAYGHITGVWGRTKQDAQLVRV